MTLREKLYDKAIALKACNDVKKILQAKNINDLITLYYRYIDFCFAYDYPGIKILRSYSEEVLTHGIVINEMDIVSVNLEKYALMNNSRAMIAATAKLVNVYAKDSAMVNITASDRSLCAVQLWGNATVKADGCDDSRIIIRLHDNAQVLSFNSHDNARIIIVK